MGIVNINDDSFCGDGRVDHRWALEKGRELVAQGADIIDVGAESARTNRPAITPEEELARLNPFLERFPIACDDLEPRDASQVFPPCCPSTHGGRKLPPRRWHAAGTCSTI